MKSIETDILIIGAGLSGLCLAYYLEKKKFKTSLVEARSRPGGRIYTNQGVGASIEMGATWMSPQHIELQQLLRDLDLSIFEQELGQTAFYEAMPSAPHQIVELPKHQEPSYRIKGGSSLLINTLLSKLDNTNLELDCRVQVIAQKESGLEVITNKGIYNARIVVSTIPPFLFQKTIKTIPALPSSYAVVADKTHTWMGESIKIGLSYKEAFWKKNGLSGTIFSNSGPITEMYDHSNIEGSEFALKGFLNSSLSALSKEERLELILDQLKKYYGRQVIDYLDYQETVWQNESFTFSPYSEYIFPHQNNGHQVFRKPYLNNQLFISGSETASSYPGYMEGAVKSAQWVYETIKGFI